MEIKYVYYQSWAATLACFRSKKPKNRHLKVHANRDLTGAATSTIAVLGNIGTGRVRHSVRAVVVNLKTLVGNSGGQRTAALPTNVSMLSLTALVSNAARRLFLKATKLVFQLGHAAVKVLQSLPRLGRQTSQPVMMRCSRREGFI
jgi:hypothetical protein